MTRNLKIRGFKENFRAFFDIMTINLISIFSKNNIKPIVSIGKKLDPQLHQAYDGDEDDHKRTWNYNPRNSKGFRIKNDY